MEKAEGLATQVPQCQPQFPPPPAQPTRTFFSLVETHIILSCNKLNLCFDGQIANLRMVPVQIKQQLQLSHLQPPVMQKVVHLLPNLKRSLKLHLGYGSSHLMT